MGSSFTRKQHSEYKWPVIPPAPKVIPNTLVLEAKEYPQIPSFQLIIHCVDKSPLYLTSNNPDAEIRKMAKEFEKSLQEYLANQRVKDEYKIYNPCIKKIEYKNDSIIMDFNGLITIGLIIQFIFINRTIYLKLYINPINFKGKQISFGFGPKIVSNYYNIILQNAQGYKSKRGYITSDDIENIHIDKVHFHCHFNESTHLIAITLYKLLFEHLTKHNCKIYNKSLLYQQNGPHICWNWQIFVLYSESIGRCLSFLMANIPNKKHLYFLFHSRTFDYVSHNRFFDHIYRVGCISKPDPKPLYVDFFKDKLREFIVARPVSDKNDGYTLDSIVNIINYWLKMIDINISDIDISIKSYIYQYSLPDIQAYDIVLFWFGKIKHNKQYCINKLTLWMTSSKDFDNEIRNKFGLLIEHILIYNQKYYERKWGNDYNGYGLLALIIIADQFTRNIYRGTPKSFMFDKYAQILCLNGINNGYFEWLFNKHPIYCWVYNLTLEHSEDIKLVEMCINKLKWIKNQLNINNPMYMFIDRDITSGGAYKHYVMIKKFNRYLQRDKILGRHTTEKEKQYLIKSGFMKMVSYKSQ